MPTCKTCGIKSASRVIQFCTDCLRSLPDPKPLKDIHHSARKSYKLPLQRPQSKGSPVCNLCANSCQIPFQERGYCGIHWNDAGKIVDIVSNGAALVHMYLDYLPSNCCASWFCTGSTKKGFNLAVFFYGCGFNCLFCQNSSHKEIDEAPIIFEDELVKAALDPQVKCVCFFGGSPEPQLPFAIEAARRILIDSNNQKHICWEWNGSGNPALVEQAVEISAISNGTVKFDLKAYHPKISLALCGVLNTRTYENFTRIARTFSQKNFLTATTPLIPYYTDESEIESIANFIASCSPNIPYSLLVFHPDFYLSDLPVTPREQVERSYEIAKKYLSNVHIGNKHLLI
jgi:pyruvate formate lyase activating enzyme